MEVNVQLSRVSLAREVSESSGVVDCSVSSMSSKAQSLREISLVGVPSSEDEEVEMRGASRASMTSLASVVPVRVSDAPLEVVTRGATMLMVLSDDRTRLSIVAVPLIEKRVYGTEGEENVKVRVEIVRVSVEGTVKIEIVLSSRSSLLKVHCVSFNSFRQLGSARKDVEVEGR